MTGFSGGRNAVDNNCCIIPGTELFDILLIARWRD